MENRSIAIISTCFAVLFFGMCGISHAGTVLDGWRSEIVNTRALAENDARLAYKDAQHLQAKIPPDATPSDKARVLNLLARVELYLALTDKATQHSAEAKQLAKQNNDRDGQIEADLNISLSAINQGRLDDMVEATRDAMDLLVNSTREDLRAEVMFQTSMMYLRFGRLDEAATIAMQSMDIARNSKNLLMRTYSLQAIAAIYDQSGRKTEALEYYQRMLESAQQAHSTLLEASAMNAMAAMASRQGQDDKVIRQLQQVIDLFRRVDAPFYVGHSLFELAARYIWSDKQPIKALPLLNEDVAIYEKYDNIIGMWWTLNARSSAFQALGRLKDARRDAERANGLAKKIGFNIYLAGSAQRLADISAAQGEFKQAYRLLEKERELRSKVDAEQTSKHILELAQRFQQESKQRQLDELKRHNEEQQAELQKRLLQQHWLWTVIGSAVLLLLISIIFLYRLRHSNKRLETSNRQLARSQNKLQATLDAIPDSLFELGMDGRYYDCHSPRTDLLPVPVGEVIGKTVQEILPPAAADVCLSALIEANKTGMSVGKQFELTLPHEKLWFELSVARKLMVTKQEPHFMVLSRDITERKRIEDLLYVREQEFRAMVENSPDIVVRYDAQCRRIYVNPAMQRQFGLPIEKILGKTPLEVSALSAVPAYMQRIEGVLKTGEESQMEFSFHDPQGVEHWGHMRLVPEFDSNSNVVSVLAITRDISERRLAEQELGRLNAELEQRVLDRTRELEAFSYSVSHDLRTPLRAIDGYAHILLEDYMDRLDDEGKRVLNVIRTNTNRMGQLIDDILQFSRTGRLELTSSGIDMEKMARDIAEELQSSGSNFQLEIEHIPPATGDSALMRQVFVNLLSNAIKFSRGKDPAKIHVGAEINGEETIYHVRDNGVGFDMRYSEKLFGVFQRLHSMEEFEGTGIGLAIVKRIVTRHGGRVWAESKVNEGTTIYFALPNQGEKS